MTLVLDFNKAPLCLTTKNLLSSNSHFTITANHSKWDVLLRGGERKSEREEEREKRVRSEVTIFMEIFHDGI